MSPDCVTAPIAGPVDVDGRLATQFPICIMPVYLPFTSKACRNVAETGVAELKVTGTVTDMIMPIVEARAFAMSTVHCALDSVAPGVPSFMPMSGPSQSSPLSLIRRIQLEMRLYSIRQEFFAVYHTMFGVRRKSIYPR